MSRIIFVFILMLVSPLVYGQQVLSAAGSSGVVQGLKIDWTIGETITETFRNSPIHLTQGFQQGTLMVTLIKDDIQNTNSIMVYPNPTSLTLNISFGDETDPNTKFLLYDSNGKLIFFNVASGELVETIDLESFPTGAYLLHIMSADQKILKKAKVLKK